MSTLSELLAEHTRLRGDAVEHLQRVVAEWQLLADMSFADFLLWVPLLSEAPDPAMRPPPTEWLCVAQARPTTAPTAHPEDVVAARVTTQENPQLRRAVAERRICREEDPRWHLEVPVRRETIPVRRGNAVLAVLSRDTNLAMPRVPSPLEIAYLGSASDLCQMIADGTFPPAASVAGRRHQPARGRRPDPPRRARPRRLRQPQRALGLPPDGTRERPRRAVARRRHPRAGPRPVRRRRGRRADPRRRSTGGTRCGWRSGRRGAVDARARAAAAAARAPPPARWCSSATSPTCAAATSPC